MSSRSGRTPRKSAVKFLEGMKQFNKVCDQYRDEYFDYLQKKKAYEDAISSNPRASVRPPKKPAVPQKVADALEVEWNSLVDESDGEFCAEEEDSESDCTLSE